MMDQSDNILNTVMAAYSVFYATTALSGKIFRTRLKRFSINKF